MICWYMLNVGLGLHGPMLGFRSPWAYPVGDNLIIFHFRVGGHRDAVEVLVAVGKRARLTTDSTLQRASSSTHSENSHALSLNSLSTRSSSVSTMKGLHEEYLAAPTWLMG